MHRNGVQSTHPFNKISLLFSSCSKVDCLAASDELQENYTKTVDVAGCCQLATEEVLRIKEPEYRLHLGLTPKHLRGPQNRVFELHIVTFSQLFKK